MSKPTKPQPLIVYTNFPGLPLMIGAVAQEEWVVTGSAFLRRPITPVLHGVDPLATGDTLPLLDRQIVKHGLPIEGTDLHWDALRERLRLREDEVPLSSSSLALRAYWALARCDIMLIWDNPDTPAMGILAMMQVASIANMPIVMVSNRAEQDPVIHSMLAGTIVPNRRLVYKTLLAFGA